MKRFKAFTPALLIIFLLSCSSTKNGLSDSSRNVLDKTYNDESIPPAFNKSTAEILLVNADFRRKKYRTQLAEIVKDFYKGQSQMLSPKDKIDKLYPDVNKYRFVLDVEGIETIRGSMGGNYSNAYGVLTVSYGIYDRVEKKSYPAFFRENRNWKMTAAYALEKMSAKLR